MPTKVNLRLIPSAKMAESGEEGIIRFPRKVREQLGLSDGGRVSVGKGAYQITLRVKRAYKPDLASLAKMLTSHKLTDREAMSVGFVDSRVYRRVTTKAGGSTWISDGVGDITIGADPEFGLVGNAGILQRGEDVVSKDGKFGSDGPGVEVRPDPSRSHLKVVSNIREILETPPKPAERYRWLGGATYVDECRTYWFGGHIHLGRPEQLEEDEAEGVYSKISTALDCLLAFPMVTFDTPNPELRRAGCTYKYGMAGDDSRLSRWPNRFEYRVLSGLWLVHPTLAKIALGAAKCVTETAYRRLSEHDFDPAWAHSPASKQGLLKSFGLKRVTEIVSAVNSADPQRVTEERLKDWERQIRGLDYFDDYSEELKALIKLAKVGTTHFGLDLRENWQANRPIKSSNASLRKALEAVEAK